MLIRYFTSNMPFQQILGIVLTGVLLWAGFFLGHDTWRFQEHAEPLSFITDGLIQNYPLIASIISLFMVLIQAFWLNSLVNRIDFYSTSKTSYLTAFLFLLFAGSLEGNFMPGPSVMANFFVLSIIQSLIYAYDKDYTLKNVFYASFASGIGSLFYMPVLGLWVFVILTLIIYRQISLREVFFAVLGLLPTAVGSLVYYYWQGNSFEHFQSVFHYFSRWNITVSGSLPELLVAGMIFIFLLFALMYVLSHANERVIKVRRLSLVLTWYLIISIGLSGYIDDFFQQIIVLSPVMAFFANWAIENMKRKKLAEMLIWIFILIITFYRLQNVWQDLFNLELPVYKLL
ncbi:MAG: DUF6427 family protein [Bacteroidales bacterium]